MHCKTSNRTQHTGGHPRLAASQAPHGHHHQLPATRADAAQAAPFAAQWPYRTFLELGALPGAVSCARLHTRLVLREWGLAALSDSTELLLSELVTNAVRASRVVWHDAVRMWLVSDLGQVVVFVWDASPQPPRTGRPRRGRRERARPAAGRGPQRALGILRLRRRGQGRLGTSGGHACCARRPPSRLHALSSRVAGTSPSSCLRPRGTMHAAYPCRQ